MPSVYVRVSQYDYFIKKNLNGFVDPHKDIQEPKKDKKLPEPNHSVNLGHIIVAMIFIVVCLLLYLLLRFEMDLKKMREFISRQQFLSQFPNSFFQQEQQGLNQLPASPPIVLEEVLMLLQIET